MQAYMCEPMITAAFTETFSESPVAWSLAPIVATLRFWGLSVLVLVTACLSQQASGVLGGAGVVETASAAAADPPGFSALAAHFEAKVGEGEISAALKFVSSFSRVLLENCFQLWLQSSFFAVVFDRFTTMGKYKVTDDIAHPDPNPKRNRASSSSTAKTPW